MRVSKLRRHIAICRRGNILKTFLMKTAESSLMTKTLICRRIIKNDALLEKFRRSPRKTGRKTGRRRSMEWCVTSKMATQGNENALQFVNNFSRPVACQPAAGQAKIFPPKINACVPSVRLLWKTRRSLIRSFSRLS